MAFLLLARSTDDALTLLAHNAFESRQEALGALGQITADPSFDAWDDEVLLIDIDGGTPVLLVRPQAAQAEPAPAAEAAPAAEPEAATFAAIADEGPVEVSAVEERVTAAPAEPEAEEATAIAQAAEELAPSVDIDEVARTIIAEAVAENVGAVLEDTEPAPTTEEDESSLLAALARTAVHMEASGIVAPASIGAPEEAAPEPEMTAEPEELPESAAQSEAIVAEPEAEPTPEPAPESETVEVPSAAPSDISDELEALAEELGVIEPEPVDVPTAEQPTSDEAPEDANLPDESADAPSEPIPPAPEPPVWPWDVTSDAPAGEESTPEPVAEPSAETAESAPTGIVLEGLEEPAIDAGGSLITSTIDDEGYAASRPVILGAYGERAADIEIDDQDVVGPMDESAIIEPGEAAPTAEDSESDFILIGEQSGAGDVVVPEGTDPASPLADYTCTDCVYVETCPNKDQRRPEDCGSFQWK